MPDEQAASSTATVEAPLTGFAAMTSEERVAHAAEHGFKPPVEKKTTEAASSPASGTEVQTEAASEPAETEEKKTRQERQERNWAAIRAENAKLKRELAESRKSAPATEKPAAHADTASLKEPSIDDPKYAGKTDSWDLYWKDVRAYDIAKAKLELRAELKAESEAAAKAKADEEAKTAGEEQERDSKGRWKKNSEKIRDADKEFDKRVARVAATIRDADVLALSEDLADSDDGPTVVAYLDQNAEAFDGLIAAYDKSEKAGLLALGKLLATMKSPQPKTITGAPPAPRSAGGRTATSVDPLKAAAERFRNGDKSGLDDYNRIMDEQRGIRRK